MKKRIGVHVLGADCNTLLARIQELESMGVHAAWLPTGSGPLDSVTLFAVAAARTSRIVLGTSIVPTYPRHPIVAVQQANVLNQVAPGRIVFGIGSSHKPRIEGMYGIPFHKPLSHTREYLHIVRSLLHEGKIDFEGQHFRVHAQFDIRAPDVPVMISALRRASFELAGAESDGAISWVCPASYLKDVALPAMKRGAQMAGRQVPPLVVHAPACVSEDLAEVRKAVNSQLAQYYLRLPFYVQMFVDAGYPEAAQGSWSDAMLDAVVLWGKEEKVAERLKGLFSMGASEIIVTPVMAGPNQDATLKRTSELVARVAGTL